MKKLFMAVAALAALGAEAKVTMGTPFADGMVLQRGRNVPVWGWANPGAAVTVTLQVQLTLGSTIDLQLTVQDPAETPVTRPESSTVATSTSEDANAHASEASLGVGVTTMLAEAPTATLTAAAAMAVGRDVASGSVTVGRPAKWAVNSKPPVSLASPPPAEMSVTVTQPSRVRPSGATWRSLVLLEAPEVPLRDATKF